MFSGITDEIKVPVRSEKAVAGDLRIIHTIAMTDGARTTMIVGRGIRSVAQGHNKAKADLTTLRARRAKGSRCRRRLTRAICKATRRLECVQRDALHDTANIVRDFAVERDFGTFPVPSRRGESSSFSLSCPRRVPAETRSLSHLPGPPPSPRRDAGRCGTGTARGRGARSVNS